MKIIEQNLEESNVYSLFVYAIRSQVTRDYYLRRLRIFFNHINLQPYLTIEERCNYFADKGTNDPTWAFNCIVRFLKYQKERVVKEEITGATLRNFIKAIKLFCEMSDIPIQWKKITRGLPKIRRHGFNQNNELFAYVMPNTESSNNNQNGYIIKSDEAIKNWTKTNGQIPNVKAAWKFCHLKLLFPYLKAYEK